MGVSADVAADRLRAMNTGIEGQFSALARAHGVNPDAAADWIRSRRSSDALAAVRDHVLGRNLRAWEPLIQAYKAAGGQ
jgi:transposase-like protein